MSANQTLTQTQNGAVAFSWNDLDGKEAIISVFNTCRSNDLDSICFQNMFPVIWNYNPIQYVALMFYLRNIRKTNVNNTQLQKGKGERLLSYYMALWLLEYHEDTFILNIRVLIEDLGYFKDCLNMAHIAKDRNMTDHHIDLILYPMAMALMIDEAKIIQGLNEKDTPLELSLAHKWAPRQGKAFTEFIPCLRKLCNITGPKPQERWRKYIRAIAQKKITIENLMSSREFDKINFASVPSLAFNLYKNAFAKRDETKHRFAEFIKRVRSSSEKVHVNIHPHEIINKYLNLNNILHNQELIEEHPATEAQWKCFTSEAISERSGKMNFIPMIDVSGSMFFTGGLSAKVALTMGILMSLMNKGAFHRKAITFASTPFTFDITGDTFKDQINSILCQPGDGYSTNFVAAFEEFLRLCKKNNIPRNEVANTRIVAFSDMQFNEADTKFNNSEFTGAKTPLNIIRELFKDSGYDIPQVIFWNVSGVLDKAPCSFGDTNVATISGFEPSMINYFLKTNEIDTSSIAFNILSEYEPLVQLHVTEKNNITH
jgi:hypothetical protein